MVTILKKRTFSLVAVFIFIALVLAPPSSHGAVADVIYYDDGNIDYYQSFATNDSVAVYFTKPTDVFKLSGMVMFCNSTDVENLTIWVLNAQKEVIAGPIAPFLDLGLLPPKLPIDFGDEAPIFTSTNTTNFYIVLQWNATPHFGIGIDSTTTSGCSYTNISGSWQQFPSGNIMIRARIEDITGPSFDHVPFTSAIIGNDLYISVEVSDDFGVGAVTLAFREIVENRSFDQVSLLLASGTPEKGIWYGAIPAENITSAGIEYYIWASDTTGNQKYYGNATTPFVVTTFTLIALPTYVTIIIISIIGIVAVILYIYLPEYKGGKPE